MVILAVDIGGTYTRVSFVNDKLEIIKKAKYLTNPDFPMAMVDKLYEYIIEQKDVVACCISCPGPLDLIAGKVLNPPNLLGFHNFDIVQSVQEKLKIPVFLNNDANLAALAEATIGLGKDFEYVQYLTISTGVGAGLVINKKIIVGAHGLANEVANSIMWKDGPKHGNIVKGGIEAISSGTAIINRAKNKGIIIKNISELVEIAKRGNLEAKQIMEDAYTYLANFIGIIYAYIDPNIVIIGGGVALNTENFLEEIVVRVKNIVDENLVEKINIKLSTIGDDNGILGAAIYAFNNLNIIE